MEATIKDFTNAFKDLFEESDETLELAKDVILNDIQNSLLGAESLASIDEYIRVCDLRGYSQVDYNNDIQQGLVFIQKSISEMKEEVGGSAIKNEILDEIGAMLEGYCNLMTIRVNGRSHTNLGIELTHPNAKIPTYAHDGDQGADIYAVEDITIEPHTYGNMIPTGLKMMIPPGWAVAIRPRSGMSKSAPLRISNSPATIDQQYRGEVKILFDNFSDKPVEIKAGDRIAQFILEKNYHAHYNVVDSVDNLTERGEGGFGSSGH